MDGVLILADRQTNSVWTHLDGIAIRGPETGKQMEIISLVHTTWEEWQDLHPDTLVLSDDTAFRSRYRDITIGVANLRQTQQFLSGDDRLETADLVLGVIIEDVQVAYPMAALAEAGAVVADTVNGVDIVLFYDANAESAIAFSGMIGGQAATFESVPGPDFRVRDSLTGTVWDFTGRGVEGPMQGETLDFVPSYISEWYGWAAFHPSTEVYEVTD